MSATFKPVRPLGDFLRLLIAPAIWFAHFSLLYGTEAVICIGPPAGRDATMGWVAIPATAAALTGLAVLATRLLRSRKTPRLKSEDANAWLRRASLLLALVSALAIVWTTLPTAVLPACAF